ncbi:MAG: hypothetical protein AAB433_11425 [Nitrospirota bacterium]
MRSINIWLIAVLITSGILNMPSASLVRADEPPSQNNSSDVTQGDAGKGTEAQGMAPPASPPTMQEEPGQPAEAGEVQERGFTLSPKVAPSGTLQPLGLLGPTPSLTAVANAIRVTSVQRQLELRGNDD